MFKKVSSILGSLIQFELNYKNEEGTLSVRFILKIALPVVLIYYLLKQFVL